MIEKLESVSTRLPESVVATLIARATEQHVSISWILREIIMGHAQPIPYVDEVPPQT